MAKMVDFPVTELGPTDHVEVGDAAPDFTRPLVNAEFWEDVALSELYGETPVVLVFHAMDGDFPALYTWREIQSRDWAAHATVVGCSISTPYEHHDFIRDRGLDYRLFSDPANGVAEAYGVVHDLDGMAGVAEPRPAVFVIDGDGVVEYAWVAEVFPERPEYDDVESIIAG